MKLNEAISFRQETEFKSKIITFPKMMAVIGALGSSVLSIANIDRIMNIADNIGPFPIITASLAPILFLVGTAERARTNEAAQISFAANQLAHIVKERDKVLRALDRATDQEQFMLKNLSKIKAYTEAQQKTADNLNRALSTPRGRAFIRDHLEQKDVNTLNKALEAAKLGTLSDMVAKRPIKEAIGRIKFNSPTTVLTTLIGMAVGVSGVASLYGNMAFNNNDHDLGVVLAASAGIPALMNFLKLAKTTEYNQMFSSVRDLEEITERRDALFSEYMKRSKSGKGEEWLAKNSQEITRLTKQQSTLASRIESAIKSKATTKELDRGSRARRDAVYAVLDAAKKGTLSDILADSRNR